jgi:hypothetical protein
MAAINKCCFCSPTRPAAAIKKPAPPRAFGTIMQQQQQLRLVALNFALAVLGLYQLANWYGAHDDRLLQWSRLEARLARDGDQPDLLAMAHEQRLLHQMPAQPPLYATYGLIYTLLMVLQLVSRAAVDDFHNALSGGALYALCAAALYTSLAYYWPALLHQAAWFFCCTVLALVLTAPLTDFQARRRAAQVQ